MKHSVSIVLAIVLVITITGCGNVKQDPAQIALKAEKEKLAASTLKECLKWSKLNKTVIANFETSNEYTLCLMKGNEIKGVRGESSGSIHGSYHSGGGLLFSEGDGYIDGETSGKVENARSITVRWLDGNGVGHQNTFPEDRVRFVARENKPATVNFSFSDYSKNEVLEDFLKQEVENCVNDVDANCKPVGMATFKAHLEKVKEDVLTTVQYSRDLALDPSPVVSDDRVDTITIIAPRSTLRHYYGYSIPSR